MSPSNEQGKTYRLTLRYLGDGFSGWQSQPDGNGVQDHLEKALSTFLRHPLRLLGGSRTDSGVHAFDQCAVFHTQMPFDRREWLHSLNALLPKSIAVRNIELTPDSFHPIRDAKCKVYRYLINTGLRDPLLEALTWHFTRPLDIAAIEDATLTLIGSHDFTSFCAKDSGAKTFVRTIYDAKVYCECGVVEIWISGDGFLKQMVRTIVGTVVDLGGGKYGPEPSEQVIREILAARDRRRAGPTAPAKGLALIKIFYGSMTSIPELRASLQSTIWPRP